MVAIALKYLADACAETGDYDLAMSYANQSITLCKSFPNSEKMVAENFITLGYIYGRKNNFRQSEYYLKEALKILGLKNYNEIESEIYNQLASLYSVTYINKGEAYKAEEYAIKAIHLINESNIYTNKPKLNPLNIPLSMARHRWRLGQVYSRLGKYENAIRLGYQEAQRIIDQSPDKTSHQFLKAHISLGMGEALLRQGRLKEAEDKLTQAIITYDRLVGRHNALFPKAFRLEVRIKLGRLKEAYEDFMDLFKREKRYEHNYGNLIYTTCIYHAAIIKYKQGDIKESMVHFYNFFEDIKHFCRNFLDKATYNALESKGVFICEQDQRNYNFHKYLKCCNDIFSAIYGNEHPFVRDAAA
jgi:tetratricopeptide (TPR) repeat protein